MGNVSGRVGGCKWRRSGGDVSDWRSGGVSGGGVGNVSGRVGV